MTINAVHISWPTSGHPVENKRSDRFMMMHPEADTSILASHAHMGHNRVLRLVSRRSSLSASVALPPICDKSDDIARYFRNVSLAKISLSAWSIRQTGPTGGTGAFLKRL